MIYALILFLLIIIGHCFQRSKNDGWGSSDWSWWIAYLLLCSAFLDALASKINILLPSANFQDQSIILASKAVIECLIAVMVLIIRKSKKNRCKNES